MKNLIITSFFIFLSLMLFSQNETDALRYSYYFPSGTARSVSMGGAFGSLGGDATSISINPAGLGVYRSGEFTITPSFEFKNSNSNFLDNQNTDFSNNMTLGNIGLIGTVNLNDVENESDFKYLNFGFSYTNLMNYNTNELISGVNNVNSVTDWFANRASGNHYSDLSNADQFYSYLAWETYLIDNVSSTDTLNYRTALSSYGQTQTKSIYKEGYVGEYNFSLGTNYNNVLYLGASIGIQSLKFESYSSLIEDDVDDLISDFRGLTFNEYLESNGAGVNFKFGFIAVPVYFVRVGASFQSPTFYNISDEWQTSLESSFVDTEKTSKLSSTLGFFDYNLNTPYKATGSLAFVLNKYGLISFDYEFADYSHMRFQRSFDYNFINENNAIKQEYKSTHNLRAGLELKLMQFRLRGGFAYFDSPYADDTSSSNDAFMYTGGIGYRTKKMFIDLTYSHLNTTEFSSLYDGVISSGSAEVNTSNSRILMTLGFRF